MCDLKTISHSMDIKTGCKQLIFHTLFEINLFKCSKNALKDRNIKSAISIKAITLKGER